MLSFEEFSAIMDEIAGSLPQEIYLDLNGGINVLPHSKLHPENISGDLFILGEYCHNRLGRYINIYYGSFVNLCVNYTHEKTRERMEGVLKHEFIHHLESLAGEKDLEIEDAEFLARYKQRLQ